MKDEIIKCFEMTCDLMELSHCVRCKCVGVCLEMSTTFGVCKRCNALPALDALNNSLLPRVETSGMMFLMNCWICNDQHV